MVYFIAWEICGKVVYPMYNLIIGKDARHMCHRICKKTLTNILISLGRNTNVTTALLMKICSWLNENVANICETERTDIGE